MEKTIVLCQPEAPDLLTGPGETVVFQSPFVEATLDFLGRDPFTQQSSPYTVAQGEDQRLTLREDVNGAYPYEVTCGGGVRKGKRPRIIIED